MASETRQWLMDAAIATLAEDGMAAVSARAVGTRAGVNPALIYYHFDDLTALLAEASRAVTVQRAAVYRDRLVDVTTLADLGVVARTLHDEEHRNGNLAMLSQLLAGSRTHPELAPVVRDNFRLLADEVATALRRILAGSPLEDVLDTRQLARAVSAGFVGIELLGTDEDDPALFDTLDTVTAIVDLVLEAGTVSGGLLRRRLRAATAPQR